MAAGNRFSSGVVKEEHCFFEGDRTSVRNFLCGAVVAAMLCGCGSGSASTARDPNTLVVLEVGDAGTTNPLAANNEPSFLYYGLIFDGLTSAGADYAVIPWLATSWTPSADGLHYTVNLRRGVRWSDGKPFTSRDVVFTWHAMLDPKVAYPYAGMFSYVRDVTALGPYRVRFDLSSRDALFASQALGSPILPEHILQSVPPNQLRTSPFGQHPVGTGPYLLSRWEHDDEAVFVRNPHWWHGPAKIPRIAFRIVLDDQARVEAIENGSADLYDTMSSADFQQIEEEDPHLSLLHLPDLYSIFMLTNLTKPGLSDFAVRRAMMFGWDREAVVRGLMHGDGEINNSIVPRALTYWYDPHVTQYTYDPARARSILDRAGWKPGADGIRERDGVRLHFELIYPTGANDVANLCAEFQSDMGAIGIAIEAKALDYATFIDRTNSFATYEIAYTGWGGTSDPDEFTFLHSSQLVPVGNNDTGYKNPIVDRDLVLGLRTIDPAKRRVYYDEMQRVTAATLPVLWGWDTFYRAAYSSRLVIDRKLALPDLSLWWNVYDWRLRP